MIAVDLAAIEDISAMIMGSGTIGCQRREKSTA